MTSARGILHGQAQQCGGVRAQRCAAHGFEQAVGHALRHALQNTGRHRRADLKRGANRRGVASAGLLYTRNAANAVKRYDACAYIDGRHIDHGTAFTNRDLRGAAADIEFMTQASRESSVPPHPSRTQRAWLRAHHSADGDKLSGLGGKQSAMGARCCDAPRRGRISAPVSIARGSLWPICMRIDKHPSAAASML